MPSTAADVAVPVAPCHRESCQKDTPNLCGVCGWIKGEVITDQLGANPKEDYWLPWRQRTRRYYVWMPLAMFVSGAFAASAAWLMIREVFG